MHVIISNKCLIVFCSHTKRSDAATVCGLQDEFAVSAFVTHDVYSTHMHRAVQVGLSRLVR